MRTTLDIDDSVLAAARAIADTERRSLGSVVSELAKRGLMPVQRTADDFPTFDVPVGSEPITPAMVQRALED